jgi:hypothetical protein
MQFGNPNTFAIECHHDPIPNPTQRVFGRMCICAGEKVLGNIDEPACMLNVTEAHLQGLTQRLLELENRELATMSALDAFTLFDFAIYLDDDRSMEQVESDALRYFKYDFLTNGGESFDGTKSFIHSMGNTVRILFTDRSDRFHSMLVEREEFEFVINQFLSWLVLEGKTIPRA